MDHTRFPRMITFKVVINVNLKKFNMKINQTNIYAGNSPGLCKLTWEKE